MPEASQVAFSGQLGSQSGDSINCSLALSTTSILGNLTQKMLNSLSWVRLLNTLSSLYSSNLETLEEFRCFDCQTSSNTSDPGLGCQVGVQFILSEREIGWCERSGGCELRKGEFERGLSGLWKVDWGEGGCSGGDIWDTGKGCLGSIASYNTLDGSHSVLNFRWECGATNDEAGFCLSVGDGSYKVKLELRFLKLYLGGGGTYRRQQDQPQEQQ